MRRLFAALLLSFILIAPLTRSAAAQLDPGLLSAIAQSAVQVGVILQNDAGDRTWFPVGSGVVVAPTGLVLTNQHVIDTDKAAAELALQQARDSSATGFSIVPGSFLLAISDGRHPPAARFIATVAASDPALDLAVLQVQSDDRGAPVNTAELNLPFVAPADSNAVDIGEPLHIFGFPAIGNESLTYTTGIASGFLYEEGIDGPAWINTDALMSGGNSGGPVMDHAGDLIGIATSGTPLDCRPGDVNNDGVTDAADAGCVPTGGSLGQVRPIDLALPLLRQVDPGFGSGTSPLVGASNDAVNETSAPGELRALGQADPAAPTADAAQYIATGQGCAARGDWRCAARYLAAAHDREPANAGLTANLYDAYLGLGGLEQDSAQLSAARAAYDAAVTLDPTRPEATNALNQLTPYARMLFADGFGGEQRYSTADDTGSNATYGDGVLNMSITNAGLISTFPLADIPAVNYAVAMDVPTATGGGAFAIELDGDDDWLFSIDPVNGRWGLLHNDPATGQFTDWVQPVGFTDLTGSPVTRVELRLVEGSPALLINGIDVAALQAIPLPTMPATGALRFGASMDPGSDQPFNAGFDRVSVFELI